MYIHVVEALLIQIAQLLPALNDYHHLPSILCFGLSFIPHDIGLSCEQKRNSKIVRGVAIE